MLALILEAAFRSLLMALAVWAGIRLLRLHHVLAQKVAWVLVLLAAGIMPLVMRAPFLARHAAVSIPVRKPSLSKLFAAGGHSAAEPETSAGNQGAAVRMQSVPPIPKPSAARPLKTGQIVLIERDPIAPSAIAGETTMASAPKNAAPPPRLSRAPHSWISTLTWARIGLWLAVAYFAVGGLLLLRTIFGLAVALRIWLRAEPALGVIGADPETRVRVSPDLTTPVTIGSSILLPADYEAWDPAKLRIVLAHEQSHVHQRDFYLQLFAAVHVAVFWFSPLGWWLQRKLSELGEALSDRAGLAQAPDRSTYAQVLLDFAATPHPVFTGVPMARNTNLASRIERILNDSRFRLAFLGGRRPAALAALLTPAALLAAITLVRIAPAVEAAQTHRAGLSFAPGISMSPGTSQAPEKSEMSADSESGTGPEYDGAQETGQVSSQGSNQVLTTDPPSAAPKVSAIAPAAPEPPPVPEPPPAPDWTNLPNGADSDTLSGEDGPGPFTIVHEKGDGGLKWQGEYNDRLAETRKKMGFKGDYIWFERDGQSYVITDPALLAQARGQMQRNLSSDRLQATLNQKQAELNQRMAEFNRDASKARFDTPEMRRQMADLSAQIAKAQLDSPEMKREMAQLDSQIAKVQLNSPELQRQMAELNAKLAELQSDKFKKLTEDLGKHINEEVLEDLQSRLGDIQGQIGEIQGKIGERQGKFGEQMGRIGEQMGRLGEEQGRIAGEASRKMKSLFDQALRDGKAKPID